jgi:hypothetical protein
LEGAGLEVMMSPSSKDPKPLKKHSGDVIHLERGTKNERWISSKSQRPKTSKNTQDIRPIQDQNHPSNANSQKEQNKGFKRRQER